MIPQAAESAAQAKATQAPGRGGRPHAAFPPGGEAPGQLRAPGSSGVALLSPVVSPDPLAAKDSVGDDDDVGLVRVARPAVDPVWSGAHDRMSRRRGRVIGPVY